VKLPKEAPEFREGSDLDIFCLDLCDIARRLHSVGQDMLSGDQQLIASRVADAHWHYDIVDGSKLNFRFDLYAALPAYRRLQVKPSLFESVIENAIDLDLAVDEGLLTCRVPMKLDDLLIRYLEYCEYYSIESGKIKHLQWIERAIKDDHERHEFFERLHHYTALPVYDPSLEQRDAQIGQERDRLQGVVLDLQEALQNLQAAAEQERAELQEALQNLRAAAHQERAEFQQALQNLQAAAEQERAELHAALREIRVAKET